jgi:hypothetical protein
MRCCLDGRASQIKIVHDFKGSRVSEEDTEAGVWHDTSVTGGCRLNVDAAAESPERRQVGERGAAHLVRARWAVAVGNEVVYADVVIKRIRPKVRLQICTREHCTKCVTDRLVGLLAWSVLMRGVRAGEFHGVSEVDERSMDVPTFAEFASSVHAHVFVGALRRIARQPAVDPIDWWRLRCKSSSDDPATEMVGEKDVAGFAVETDKVVVSFGVAALLNHEPEVDGQTLVARGRSHRGGLSGGCFPEFGSEAYGTVFNFRRDLELRYAFDKAMHFREATKIEMSKALVPEHA